MLWSGSSPLAVVRAGMWGFLLFAGAAWLAIAWSVLRLQPSDIVHVAGPVVLFGALTEAVRALSGTRTWWLNAGMAALFAVTGCVLLANQDSSFTTPAALLGWYLMVRGAADVAVSMMTRETDRIWGLLMVVGVAETGLGFFAASPLSRTADLVVTVLGGLALTRGVADLVAALRLREAAPAAPPVGLLELPPERAAGVAGYSAGLSDYESAPPKSGARHRAPTKSQSGMSQSDTQRAGTPLAGTLRAGTSQAGTSQAGTQQAGTPQAGAPAAVDVGDWSMSAGSIGPVRSPGQAVAGGMAGAAGFSPGMGESVSADWTPVPEWTGPIEWSGAHAEPGGATVSPGALGQSPASQGVAAQEGSAGHASVREAGSRGPAAHRAAAHGSAARSAKTGQSSTGHPSAAQSSAAQSSAGASSFHDEVLRTTADLDAMLALAGVTGAAVGAGLVHYEVPEIPDTPEGAELSDTELSDTAEMGVVSER
jgi:uncharacterized membrane protein HdeD (DUF308 family)